MNAMMPLTSGMRFQKTDAEFILVFVEKEIYFWQNKINIFLNERTKSK